MAYVPLHVHSHYSLLDGLGTPKAIVQRAKELGFSAVAVTDHGNLYGAIEFYKAAKAEGIKPIIGCEVYVSPGSRFDRIPGEENKPFHLILLAENYEGYRNLMELLTKANLEGFYYKPRMDYGLMKAHSKGIIALSACLAGEVAQAVAQGDNEKQLEVIRRYQDIFGRESFFLELQDHPFLDEQKTLNQRLIELSKLTGAPLVATQDSHYIYKDDEKVHDILLCIQTQTSLDEEDRMKFKGDFSMQGEEEMRRVFAHVPEAIDNTVKIAERCDLKLEFNKNLIPVFKTPGNETAAEYLRKLCGEGLKQKYGDPPLKKAVDQLEYELDVVHKMGFDDYFLIVYDFVKFARDSGITVGPGRGSAAGSVITYCLNITQLDPLQYGLIFERFLNPERVSMPDIDIDFADTRRDEVLAYVSKKYGWDCVAQIITFGTMAARAAVRDTGRAMGYPYAEVDRIAKLIPPPIQGRHAPLKITVETNPEIKSIYQKEPRTKALLDNAIKLEGTVRHAGTHASAVVMSQEALSNYVPLQKSTSGGGEIITQYSMKPIEDIGLLKIDFLGLKNLSIIQRTLQLLKFRRNLEIDLEKISMKDPQTFRLLQKVDTTGVFQLESAGMRRYVKELVIESFEDIIAMISLYRPGPMEWIPQYIKSKHHPEQIRYLHPSFEKILKETNGVAIYQEQILQIARDFAGFSLGEADILRKAVGKKIASLLNEQKEKFVKGAMNKGHQQKFALEVFEKVIEPFAAYGFNKAHAACYAMISYQTAYLKAHYPVEFMAALLSSDHGNTDRVVLEMNECAEMGIAVLPPSVNESFSNFTVVDEQTIRFGLAAIKGLGEGVIQDIIAARKQSRFISLEDFLKRVPLKVLNKKTLEALAYSGAMDEFGDRKAIAESYEAMVDFAKYSQVMASQGQTDIFGVLEEHQEVKSQTFNLRKTEGLTLMEKLALEKKYLGLYVSNHPLKGLKKYLAKKINLVEKLSAKMVGKQIKMGGLLSNSKRVFTKAGTHMIYGELEDPSGRIEIVIFPKVYQQFQSIIEEGQLYVMEGKLERRRDTLQFSVSSLKAVSLESMIKNAREEGLYDEKEKMSRKQKVFEAETVSDPLEEGFTGFVPSQADSGFQESWQENPYVIEMPDGLDLKKMEDLKKILLRYPGTRGVEIHLRSGKDLKRIKVPFEIEVGAELQKNIEEIIS